MLEAFPKKSGRKVVYYGPEQSGKSTNLDIIFGQAPEENRSQLLSLSTDDSPPLFYDYLKLSLDNILQRDSKFELYTFPGKATQILAGQATYHAIQRKLLADVDGLIFVFDSQLKKLPENLKALKTIEDFFVANQINIATFPIVLQYNKRDLPDILSVEKLNEQLNKWNYPYHNTIATQGVGVFQTLKTLTRIIFNKKKSTPDIASSSAQSMINSPQQEQLQETDTYFVPEESMPSSPQVAQYPYPNPYPAAPTYQQPYYQNPYPQPPSGNYMYPQAFSPPPYASSVPPSSPYPSPYSNPINMSGHPMSSYPNPPQPSSYPSPYPTQPSPNYPPQSSYGMETSSFAMPANPSAYHPQFPYPSDNNSPPSTMANYPQNPGYGGNNPYPPPGYSHAAFQGNSNYPQPPSSNYFPPQANPSFGRETTSFSMPLPPQGYQYPSNPQMNPGDYSSPPSYPYPPSPMPGAQGYPYSMPPPPSAQFKFEPQSPPKPFPAPLPRVPGEETDLFPKPPPQQAKPKFPFQKPPQNPPPHF